MVEAKKKPEKPPAEPNPYNLVKAFADGILILMLLIALTKLFLMR